MANYAVRLDAGDDSFTGECGENTRLLEALSASGSLLRKPCRNGVCGLCRCRLVSGEITYQWRVPHGLWEKDIKEGYILPCIAYPLSDLVLDKPSLEQLSAEKAGK